MEDQEFEELTQERKLANAVEATLREFLLLPDEHAYVATTLWILHSHLRDVSGEFLPNATPRLYFGSDKPGAGKTLATELVTKMSYKGEMILEPTSHSITTMLNVDKATPGLDEIDLYFGNGRGNTRTRAILNGGYKKGGRVTRERGGEVEWQNCHGPLIMNGKNASRFLNHENFATLRDRSIAIVLQRKQPGVRLGRYDSEKHDMRLFLLMSRLMKWGQSNGRAIVKINVETIIPEEIDNRDRELWTILFRLAQHLGGEWPQRVEAAARAFVLGERDVEEDETFVDPYEELLGAVRAVFREGEEFLSTVDILDRLGELEELPQLMDEWVGFKGSTMGLSRGLGVSGVKHVRVQVDGDQQWGYSRRSLGSGPVATAQPVAGRHHQAEGDFGWWDEPAA